MSSHSKAENTLSHEGGPCTKGFGVLHPAQRVLGFREVPGLKLKAGSGKWQVQGLWATKTAPGLLGLERMRA